MQVVQVLAYNAARRDGMPTPAIRNFAPINPSGSDTMSGTIADLLTAALERREAEQQRPRKKKRPRCGAKTKAGPPCKAPAVWDNVAKKP